MAQPDYKSIALDGLWRNNPATVQVLGLCPLLAVSGTVVNALGLGLATLVVLVASNGAVSLLRHRITDTVRLPAFVMIIAALVSAIEMLMQAFTFELYQILGIFIPLIVTNCTVLGRADGFASRQPLLPSLLDGLMMGCGFLLVLVLLGGLREWLGQGTLFANMELLFGPAAAGWRLQLIDDYQGFLLAVLPPGAFLGLGFLIAAKNIIDARLSGRRQQAPDTSPRPSRRVRTTGKIG
ncbi:electron transport complex subunit RsxE [Alcanivorax sp. N3-2A]|nr:electron transport complex subunit RsxE [Alcanivorax sp. N3-2A]|tara:strand:+ start:14783 stop:15496 length:714 start_codon:yes stop_codon:yes gene_type:complete